MKNYNNTCHSEGHTKGACRRAVDDVSRVKDKWVHTGTALPGAGLQYCTICLSFPISVTHSSQICLNKVNSGRI